MQTKEISILVVEDHELTREALARVLAGEYSCSTAATAEDAIELIERKYFNLILVDIQLPGASGLEICRLLSKMNLDTKVIVITGMNDIRYRAMALRLGALYFVEKPFELDKLLIWVQSALRSQALARTRGLYASEGLLGAKAS